MGDRIIFVVGFNNWLDVWLNCAQVFLGVLMFLLYRRERVKRLQLQYLADAIHHVVKERGR